MGKFIRVGKYLVFFAVANVCAFFLKLFRPSLRNIWIISERGNDARDNGYFFYKYLIEKHPEIRVYYIIKNNSADAQKIRPQDRIEYNRFRHFLYFAICKVRISSHAWGGDIPGGEYYSKFGFYKRSKKKVIFLQHGITKDFQPNLCYPKIKPSLFICGSDAEYEYIRRSFGHPEGIVSYTGFARYDTLSDCTTKNQILIMPTFRKFLQRMDEDSFQKTQYFLAWQNLLNSSKIIELLEKKQIDLLFYPHYEMQKYIHLFHSHSPRVIIADFAHFDVQTLLKESKLMVTDFSSVFFDFSYMKKPVLFYQFDRERYIREHYDFRKGYFDYDTMAPGKVVFRESELVDNILHSVNQNFQMENLYQFRRDQFFKKSDRHNCDRIFEAICEIIK